MFGLHAYDTESEDDEGRYALCSHKGGSGLSLDCIHWHTSDYSISLAVSQMALQIINYT